ncbi:MAG: GNAT family N-acetyltransferase [Nostoc sp. S4]|nr:GNAT family N-acetyltransferase [Nostoc sp. S4]
MNETPVGHVLLHWDSDTPGEPDAVRALHIPRVEDLWVMPEHRGKGISRYLMNQVEELARSQGHTQIGLDVAMEDYFARTLYKRRGYKQVGIDEYKLSGVNTVDGKEYSWQENCIFLILNL